MSDPTTESIEAQNALVDSLRKQVIALQTELDLLKPSAEILQEGAWRPCSGCHETDEGHPTGPFSDTLQCHLGIGCHECGGIGATWEHFGGIQCCARFAWGDGTHEPDCPKANGPTPTTTAVTI